MTDVEWKRVHSEPISFFEDYYQDLNYNFAWDPASHSDMYIYSPESVIKVQVLTLEDKAELYSLKGKP